MSLHRTGKLAVTGGAAVAAVTVLNLIFGGLIGVGCDTAAPPPGHEDFPCHFVTQSAGAYVALGLPVAVVVVAALMATRRDRWRPLILGIATGIALSALLFVILLSGLPRRS